MPRAYYRGARVHCGPQIQQESLENALRAQLEEGIAKGLKDGRPKKSSEFN